MNKKNLPVKQVYLFVLLFSLISGFAAGQSCPSGMVAYWKLQEASGPTYNDSYGSHDALAATAAPSQTSGISGKGQLFNAGATTQISIPDHSDFDWAGSASFSIEFWVKYTETGGDARVFIGRDDPSTSVHWWIGETTTGEIEWTIINSNGTMGDLISSSSYNNGQWHHVVAVRDGSAGKLYLYVDGTVQSANYSTSGNLYSTSDISVGCLVYNENPDFYFSGSIDEVAIYNRTLSSSEISGLYDNARLFQIGYCDGDNPVIISSPIIYATVGQQYAYDVDASGNSTPIYSLIEKPTGMAIDQVTGVITWTPASATLNGKVTVRATNNKGSVEQSFYVYISQAPSCRNNLAAYWDFDETGSSPYYDNIAGYKLTGTGATHVTGKVGSALSFDGTNDSLNMKDEAEPSNVFFDFDNIPSFSIELWMKSNATPSGNMVLIGRDFTHYGTSNKTHYWIGVTPAGAVELTLIDYSGSNVADIQGGSVLDGGWHQIVATYDASSDAVKLYVDKTVVAEVTQNFLNFGCYADLNIGYLDMGGTDYFWYLGLLDEIAVYNTALTESRIISNYNDASAGKSACVLNFAPVITTTADTVVNQGANYYYKLIATDINPSDAITITAVTKPSWLVYAYVSGDSTAILSGAPSNANVGFHNVTLRVSDGTISVDQTFKIHVKNINDAPTITSAAVITVNEDALYTYTVVGNDIDGDALTYSAPTKPNWLTIDPVTHILSGTPTNEDVGVVDVTVSVTDGTLSADQSFQITVANVNDLPVVTSTPPLQVRVNESYMYEMTATDVDAGDVLTFSVNSKPSWLNFTAGSGSGILIGSPATTDVGSHAIIMKVSDGHEDVLQGFTITVLPLSAIPTVENGIVNYVYPNPASDIITFKFAKSGSIRVEIYDITGNKLREAKADNENTIGINIADFSNGLYLYKAYQNNKLSVGKITKN